MSKIKGLEILENLSKERIRLAKQECRIIKELYNDKYSGKISTIYFENKKREIKEYYKGIIDRIGHSELKIMTISGLQ